jgi:hypothetical protein
MDLLHAVYMDVGSPALLIRIARESSQQEETLESFLQASGWGQRLLAKNYVQLGAPRFFNTDSGQELPRKLSELLESKRYTQHYVSGTTEWEPISHDHEAAIAFRQHQAELWKDLT